jgi:hypothetical protein
MSAEEIVAMLALLVEGVIFLCLQEPIFMSIRGTAKKIVHWSLVVKIGGSIIGVFWFLQLIKDELLPEELEARLRLLNLIPHWPWYVWLILALLVCLIGLFEGTYRWNKHEVAPIIGWPETLQNEAFLLATKIRDFIEDFTDKNGLPPEIYPTGDENTRTRMQIAASDWNNRFTQQFRVNLRDEVGGVIDRIRAEGIPMDYAMEGILIQPHVNPNSVMLLAGLLMGGGLALTLKK